MERGAVQLGIAVRHAARRHIGFHSDDRLQPRIGRRLVKFHRAVEVAVIGDRDRRHLHFGRFCHQRFHPHRPVEERIFGVKMEMNERISGHAASV